MNFSRSPVRKSAEKLNVKNTFWASYCCNCTRTKVFGLRRNAKCDAVSMLGNHFGYFRKQCSLSAQPQVFKSGLPGYQRRLKLVADYFADTMISTSAWTSLHLNWWLETLLSSNKDLVYLNLYLNNFEVKLIFITKESVGWSKEQKLKERDFCMFWKRIAGNTSGYQQL